MHTTMMTYRSYQGCCSTIGRCESDTSYVHSADVAERDCSCDYLSPSSSPALLCSPLPPQSSYYRCKSTFLMSVQRQPEPAPTPHLAAQLRLAQSATYTLVDELRNSLVRQTFCSLLGAGEGGTMLQ